MSAPLVPLGKVALSMRNGLSPARGGTVEGEVLTLSAVTQGRFRPEERKPATFDVQPSPEQKTRPGMFLMCRGNGNLSLVGAGVAVPPGVSESVFPDTVIGAVLNEAVVDSRYLAYAWATEAVRSQLEAGARTTNGTYKVNQQVLEAIRVPLPPLPEQRRIAAILDEADTLRRKRREALALLDELLRATFLDMFGDPVRNPRGWPTAPLGSICDICGGGTPSRAVAEYFTGDTCWATCKDMGHERLVDTEEHVTGEAIRNSATKLVPKGSLLVVVKSKVLMNRLPVAITEVETCFGQDLKALLLQPDWPAEYVARHLRVGQRALLERARGANTEGLTLEHLREYRLLAPPRQMRVRFASFEADVLGQRRRAQVASAKAETLFSSLLHRAFSGDL